MEQASAYEATMVSGECEGRRRKRADDRGGGGGTYATPTDTGGGETADAVAASMIREDRTARPSAKTHPLTHIPHSVHHDKISDHHTHDTIYTQTRAGPGSESRDRRSPPRVQGRTLGTGT